MLWPLCLIVFLSEFFYSKPFQNNLIHCEITDCHLNIFFVEIQLKLENLKKDFWVPEFGCPKQYIDLPNSLNMKQIMNWNSTRHIWSNLQMSKASFYWPRNCVMDAWNQYLKPIKQGTAINTELARFVTRNILCQCMNLS